MHGKELRYAKRDKIIPLGSSRLSYQHAYLNLFHSFTIWHPFLWEQECCLSGGGGDGSGMEGSMGWVELESAATPWMYRYPLEHEPGAVMVGREIETLPLFPIKQEEEQEGEEVEKKGEFITGSHLNNCNNTTNNNNDGSNNQCLPAFYWGGGQEDQVHHLYNHHHNDGSGGAAHPAASLDLTLNSCYYAPPGSTWSHACHMASPEEVFPSLCCQAWEEKDGSFPLLLQLLLLV